MAGETVQGMIKAAVAGGHEVIPKVRDGLTEITRSGPVRPALAAMVIIKEFLKEKGGRVRQTVIDVTQELAFSQPSEWRMVTKRLRKGQSDFELLGCGVETAEV